MAAYAALSRGRWMGLCPLHDDHQPSFLMDPHKNLFYCYGCGRGGDVIRFAEIYHQVRFPQALTLLRQWRGLQPLLQEVAGFYRMQLHRHGEAVAYLRHRGLCAPELIEHMRIGYAPGGCLRGWLTRLGYSLPALRQAGLVPSWDTTPTCIASFSRWKGIFMAALSRLRRRLIGFCRGPGWTVFMEGSLAISGSALGGRTLSLETELEFSNPRPRPSYRPILVLRSAGQAPKWLGPPCRPGTFNQCSCGYRFAKPIKRPAGANEDPAIEDRGESRRHLRQDY